VTAVVVPDTVLHMIATKPTKRSTAKNAFTLGIAAYAVVWLVVLAVAWRVFGSSPAVGLSLILLFPLVVAVRMRFRWSALKEREFAFLFMLLAVVLGAGVFTVWRWCDAGVHTEHASDMRFEELTRAAQADSAFRDIKFSITDYKGRYVITGTVASKADLDRFQELCDQYDFRSFAKSVVVMTSAPQKGK
jgi:hypothetical protein